MKVTLHSTLNLTINAVLASLFMSTAVSAKHLTIGLDISSSNPLFADKIVNTAASRYIKQRMKSIRTDDVVTLRFIGSLNDTKSLQKTEQTITYQNINMMKSMATQMVLAAPKHIKSHGSTNLIAFFERNQFDCDTGGEVILLTDGIEASEYVRPNDLLSGQVNLPKPSEFVQLKGCHVTFYGIGAARSNTELNRLRRQWQAYFKAAGATFTAVVL